VIFNELKQATITSIELEFYLSGHFQYLYDFFNQSNHHQLVGLKKDIDQYIKTQRYIILELNSANKTNLAFISLLVSVCERLSLKASFSYLFNHLQKNNFDVGIRLRAASLYLNDTKEADDYLNVCYDICCELQRSYQDEADNADQVLMTLINFYAKIVYDFGEYNNVLVEKLNNKLKQITDNVSFYFLQHDFVKEIIKIDIRDHENAYRDIHAKLDYFLGRSTHDIETNTQYTSSHSFLIETDSVYVDLLQNTANTFEAIRKISVNLFDSDDAIFKSLSRGVAVLTDEKQLYAYMKSYGAMHFAKLNSSFSKLPTELFNQDIDIIDWGCGQAMATMTLMDFLSKRNIKSDVKNVILIEPSEIALKRAALHTQKLISDAIIHTVNKDIDSVSNHELSPLSNRAKLHLFSNILDIDLFSLSDLLSLIDNHCSGENYFVCASPFINDTKTSRINSFVDYFSNKTKFEEYLSIDSKAGEWQSNWTRVLRVFKASI
jgi:hypothetical protein